MPCQFKHLQRETSSDVPVWHPKNTYVQSFHTASVRRVQHADPHPHLKRAVRRKAGRHMQMGVHTCLLCFFPSPPPARYPFRRVPAFRPDCKNLFPSETYLPDRTVLQSECTGSATEKPLSVILTAVLYVMYITGPGQSAGPVSCLLHPPHISGTRCPCLRSSAWQPAAQNTDLHPSQL